MSKWIAMAVVVMGWVVVSASAEGDTSLGGTQTCAPGRSCTFTCLAGGCDFACAAGASCIATCSGGGCKQACAAGASCTFTCSGGACTQQCDGACLRTCSGGHCK